MKRLLYLILSLTIVFSVSVIGCSTSPKESEPANIWAISLLDKVPNGSSLCRITNISAMHSDNDLSTMDPGYIFSDELEINYQNFDYSIETDGLTVLVGNCSLEDLKANLNKNGTNHRTILAAEAWDFESKLYLAANNTPFVWIIGMHDDFLFVGASEDAIKDWLSFIASGNLSINTNPKFNELFSRLPAGFWVTYSTKSPDGLDSQGFEALAGVMSKKGSGIIDGHRNL